MIPPNDTDDRDEPEDGAPTPPGAKMGDGKVTGAKQAAENRENDPPA